MTGPPKCGKTLGPLLFRRLRVKLTPLQRDVLQKMKDGWPMGVSYDGDHRWLQKNGVGRGGECIRVHASTFKGLSLRGLIHMVKCNYPTRTWGITEAGLKALED
jgi:hypothetical protein